MADENQKSNKAVVVAIIGGIAVIAAAAIGIIPNLTSKTDTETKEERPNIIVKTDGQGHTVIAGGEDVTVNQTDPTILKFLDKGLPESEHIYVELGKPIADQIRLFPTDEVEIFATEDELERVWLGGSWKDFKENRKFVVIGIPGEPITPKFEGPAVHGFKVKVTYTRHRGEVRDPNNAIWNSGLESLE
jgi:hypothetical protein